MIEITPITPYQPVNAPLKVEREQRDKRNPEQRRPHAKQDRNPNNANPQPAEHIDEIV
ncbi:hypothetical protein [Methylomonas koyamae]|nr:hypothetical protein [Methylomonas koyamae]ATG88838.1 hypothetical protein MKLM6_0563 [Methylomonas koyamae]BBL56904.1 hypothetical protein MKFW12EY_05170 [Methylomonas koyamae]